MLAVAPFAIVLLSVIVMLGTRYLEEFAFQLVCIGVGALYVGIVLRAAYSPPDTATNVVAAISFLAVFFATDGFGYLSVQAVVCAVRPIRVRGGAGGLRADPLPAGRAHRRRGGQDRACGSRRRRGFLRGLRRATASRRYLVAKRCSPGRSSRIDTASASRSLELINDDDDSESYPLATVSGLRYALRRVGERMNRDEDVVVLMLTSHGSSDGELSVSQSMMMLAQLDGQDVRNALDDAGIKWSVVIVSACYAGTFLEPLKSPRTLVITAADARHNSFGCADDRDLTYFGEAFLRDALPGAASLPEAYEKARTLIAEREKAEGKTLSNPQLFLGEEMVGKLAKLEAARAAD